MIVKHIFRVFLLLFLCWGSSGTFAQGNSPGIQDDGSWWKTYTWSGAAYFQFYPLLGGKDWVYTFTQEWPVPRNPRHQHTALPINTRGLLRARAPV